MHKLVNISGIVNRQPGNRLNSYVAHSAFRARRKQDGVQIMIVYTSTPVIVMHRFIQHITLVTVGVLFTVIEGSKQDGKIPVWNPPASKRTGIPLPEMKLSKLGIKPPYTFDMVPVLRKCVSTLGFSYYSEIYRLIPR